MKHRNSGGKQNRRAIAVMLMICFLFTACMSGCGSAASKETATSTETVAPEAAAPETAAPEAAVPETQAETVETEAAAPETQAAAPETETEAAETETAAAETASDDVVNLSGDSSDFVLITDVVPDAILEIRYYSTYNFVGDRIDGYEEPLAFLTKEAAAALKEVSDDLREKGYRLKIYDAYRPQMAVTNFVEWAKDEDDTRMKEYFYPELEKDVLFPQGYIAEHSGHSRGSTVDLTIFDMTTEKEVDMGGTFDYFGELSHPDYTDITEEQYENRMILRDAMLAHGFKPLEEEWWHFTLADEPYPDTYFTFTVNSESLVGAEADQADTTEQAAVEDQTAAGKKVYFAGPLFNDAEREYNQKLVTILESHGYEVFLPQRDGYLAPDLEGKTEEEITEMIFQKDRDEVLGADIIFMVLDGRVPDDGACVELGIAYASGKRCYGIKNDARAIELNMDLNPMIAGCFDKLFYNLDGEELIKELEEYLENNEL